MADAQRVKRRDIVRPTAEALKAGVWRKRWLGVEPQDRRGCIYRVDGDRATVYWTNPRGRRPERGYWVLLKWLEVVVGIVGN